MKKGIVIHPEEVTEQMMETVINAGVEVLGLHPVGGKETAKTLAELVELMKTEDFQNKLNYLREHGVQIEYQVHATSYLLPRELFADHPDWFRVNEEGVRSNDTNLCPSCQEALDYISDSAEKLAKIIPSDTGKYYLWLDDIADATCHCEKCKELSSSDQAMLVFNAILKGLRRVDPNAKECFLAYSDQKWPPQKVMPDEGIFLEFAPMRNNSDKPFATNPENEKFIETIDPLLEFFGKEDSVVLEYWLDNSFFSDWKKPPKKFVIHPEVIREDIKFYKDKGFEEITNFACYLSDDYRELYGEAPIAEYIKCYEE